MDLMVIDGLKTVEASRAEQIRNTFLPMATMLESFEAAYNEIIEASKAGIDGPLTAKAKRLRIDIGRVRIETEKTRKAEKEESLRAGKAIDGVANVLKWAVTDKENKLKEIEDHFEIIEQKKKEALQAERVASLSQYVDDVEGRDLSTMDDDVWAAYLTTKKKDFDDRIEAERKAAEEKAEREKAEAEERARIKAENDKLKAEAAEREKAEAKRRAKEAAERKALEDKLKAEAAERSRLEAEKRKSEQAERERLAKEAAEKAKAEKVAANKRHRAKVEAEAYDSLIEIGFDHIDASRLIVMIRDGKIKNVTINY